VAKRVAAESFHDVRRSGLIAIKLQTGDALQSVSFTDKGDQAIVVTARGQSVRFKESDIRVMGRAAGGVRAIRLKKADTVVATEVIGSGAKNPMLLVLSSNGFGKRTPLSEYKVQKRGGSGIKTANVTTKTGDIMTAKIVTDDDEEIVAMSKKSQVIRTEIKQISTLGRLTQGVRVMKLREGDSIASLICL